MKPLSLFIILSCALASSCGRESTRTDAPRLRFDLVDQGGRVVHEVPNGASNDLYLRAIVTAGEWSGSDLQIEVIENTCATLSVAAMTLSRRDTSQTGTFNGKPIQIRVDDSCPAGQFLTLKIRAHLTGEEAADQPVSTLRLRIRHQESGPALTFSWAPPAPYTTAPAALQGQPIASSLLVRNSGAASLDLADLHLTAEGALQKPFDDTVVQAVHLSPGQARAVPLPPSIVPMLDPVQEPVITFTLSWQEKDAPQSQILTLPVQEGLIIVGITAEPLGDPTDSRDLLPFQMGWILYNNSQIPLGSSSLLVESIEGGQLQGNLDRLKIPDLAPWERIQLDREDWVITPRVASISEKITIKARWDSGWGYTSNLSLQLIQKEKNRWVLKP